MRKVICVRIIRTLLPGTFAIALLATLLLFAQYQVVAQGSTDPVVRVDPSTLSMSGTGITGTQEVQVMDVTDLYGVEFSVEYDPDVIQPVDAGGSMPGVQIGVGPVFTNQDPDYYVGRNIAYTETGTIEFQATLRSPAAPFSGTGAVASITWECMSSGDSPITFTMSKLASSPDGDPITHTVQGGSVTCDDGGGSGSASLLQGQVLLQGRDTHEGTYIFVTTEDESVSAAQVTLEVPIPGVPYTTTDVSGDFAIYLYEPPDLYELPYRCLQAIHKGYLIGQYCPAGGFTGDENLGTIVLPGGDATEDDQINIFDLALIAARYGGNDSTADINGDGMVDIYDLVITAGNLNENGPVTDWQ